MNSKNLFLASECLGKKMLLVAVTPDMYADGKRVEEPVGYRYDICLCEHGYDKLSVRIPGPQQVEIPTPEQDVYVCFDDLRVRPYVGGNGRIAFSSSASAIHVIDDGRGRAEPKGKG